MAWIPYAIQGAGLLMSALGTSSASRAQKEEGRRRAVAAEFGAQEMELQAGQALADGGLAGREQRRQMQFAEDRIRVIAAAQGGSADPSVVNLLSRVSGEKAYRQALALYEGENRARTLRAQAKVARMSGDLATAAAIDQSRATQIHGYGQTLQMGASLYQRYNQPSPEAPAKEEWV